MDGNSETAGIVACLEPIISVYTDASVILQKVKAKRAQGQEDAPSRLLEESIDQTPGDIEREQRRGILRYGREFEDGDHTSVVTLRQITVQLQKSLLGKLRDVAVDDIALDLTCLVDAADLGREKTIAALYEFKQRLLQAQPTETPALANEGEPKPPPGTATDPAVQKAPVEASTSPNAAVSPPNQAGYASQHSTSSEPSTGDKAIPFRGDGGRVPHKRHGSLLGFLNRRQRSSSESNGQGSMLAPPENTSDATSAPMTRAPSQPSKDADTDEDGATQRQVTTLDHHEWDNDRAEIWNTRKSSDRKRDSVSTPPEAMQPPPSPTRSEGSVSSNATSTLHTQPLSVAAPTPENDFLGFCKGAWKLQNGDRKAFAKRKEFNDGWSQSSVHYLSCTHHKCAFAGHVAVDKIWDKVYVVEAMDLKFRWAFLAKSHVPQTKVKDRQYAYQCMFCVFMGEKPPVIHGTDDYLSHVKEHRGQDMGEVVLYKAKCIADSVAADSADFDINLWPLDAGEQVDRVLSDKVQNQQSKATTSPGSPGSVSSASKPWNEGLSEFHWDLEPESTDFD